MVGNHNTSESLVAVARDRKSGEEVEEVEITEPLIPLHRNVRKPAHFVGQLAAPS